MRSLLRGLCFIIIWTLPLQAEAQKRSKEDKQQLFNELIEVVEAGEYKFVADWAYPQKGQQVSLMSRPNYLSLKGDIAKAELPYFGVVSAGAAGYSAGGSGLRMDGKITDLSIEKNAKKRRIIVKFKTKQDTEALNCIMTLNSFETVSLTIMSSNRQSIRYNGKLVLE